MDRAGFNRSPDANVRAPPRLSSIKNGTNPSKIVKILVFIEGKMVEYDTGPEYVVKTDKSMCKIGTIKVYEW